MSTLVNSILEKIDNIRVSRDNLNKAITDKMDIDASAFKVIESMNYAGEKLGQPAESYAIRQECIDGSYLAYPINVRLTTDSWVSFDFAMSEKALSGHVPLLGVSINSLRLYIEQGHLLLDIGDTQRTCDYNLDTAIHNISFGFAGAVGPTNGVFRFKVEIDNVEIYNGKVTDPNFNLPLFLFGCPSEYYGTYEDYELLGGVTFLLNEIGITFSTKHFYIFGLKVYNVNNSERNLIRDYEPTIDAEQKPCLLEKLSNEYEYPTLGIFKYVSVPNVTVKEIANSDYGSELPQQCYIKPSAGAIVPTDIKLTPTTKIVMKIGDPGTFDEVSAGATEEEILKSRVMVGAQPNLLISAYDENDVKRGLPGYGESHSITTDDLIWQMYGGKALYFGGCSNIFYSTSDTDGNNTLPTFYGGSIMFGYDVANPENANFDSDNLNKILSTSYSYTSPDYINKKAVIPTYSQFNNEMNTPICFFGNYNETTMKPDEVIALGYQNALDKIGYTTGIRYEINRIEIYDRDSDGSISRKHMLLPATNAEGVNYLKDVTTGSSYYPFKGTLDVTSGTPIQDSPTNTILTNTYVKPSAGAIVPTDIKLPALHRTTMYVKDIDAFDEALDSSITGNAALNIVRDRVMLGAQPNLIAPFNHLDYKRNLPRLPINNEMGGYLGDSSIAFFYQGSEDDGRYGINYSLYADYMGKAQTLASLNGEHTIKFGQRADDSRRLWTFFILNDNQNEAHTLTTVQTNVIDCNKKMTPLCIFGTYNYVEGKTPDDIIALDYQEALSQIGYKTGVRYAVKRIDIEDYGTDTSTGTAEPIATVHSLVPYRDKDRKICLYDTITNKSYYPYNGTLDEYTGPVQPEPPVPPTILTGSYIKPSAGAIVPTDIKFTAYTSITMDIKDMDNFDEVLDSTVTGDAALNVVKSRVMIGAQPNVIAPFNHLDYERSLPDLDINNENTGYLGDSSIGIYFKSADHNGYSIITEYGGTPGAALPSLTGEHTIRLGLRHNDGTSLWKHYYIDNQQESQQLWGGLEPDVFEYVNVRMKAPICIFGTYNLDETKTPDDVIAMGYQNALNELGYTTGVRFGIKKIEIKHYNPERVLIETYSLVPARDTNGTICLYDEVNNKSYYPFHGTLDII